MPLPNPIPLITKSGIIPSSGKSSNPMPIIPITAETMIKDKPIGRLFNKLLNFL